MVLLKLFLDQIKEKKFKLFYNLQMRHSGLEGFHCPLTHFAVTLVPMLRPYPFPQETLITVPGENVWLGSRPAFNTSMFKNDSSDITSQGPAVNRKYEMKFIALRSFYRGCGCLTLGFCKKYN